MTTSGKSTSTVAEGIETTLGKETLSSRGSLETRTAARLVVELPYSCLFLQRVREILTEVISGSGLSALLRYLSGQGQMAYLLEKKYLLPNSGFDESDPYKNDTLAMIAFLNRNLGKF